MKLAVVAMLRNETDIVGMFLQHLDALFDYAVLMDHGSSDGTDRALAAACAARPGWTMWHLEPFGYHQTTFNTFALRALVEHTDADWVMFLDADEFIQIADRAAFEAALSTVTNPDHVAHLRWRNAVPDRLDPRALVPGEPIWLPPDDSPFGKVAIPRAFLRRHGQEANLAIGNHGLYYTPEDLVPSDDIGDLIHLPVRSSAQIRTKIVAGVFSIMAQAVRERVQGKHWFSIMDRMADGTLRDEDLIGIATRYGEDGSTHQPISRDELRAKGFELAPLTVPFGRDFVGRADPTWIDPVQLIATILRHYRVEDAQNNELEVVEGNRVRFVPKQPPA
jgi:hypothetical protein